MIFVDNLESAIEKSLEACLPIVALKLKAFLKWAYGLSTSKCESYAPSDSANNSPCIRVLDTVAVLSPFSDIPILSRSTSCTFALCTEQYQLVSAPTPHYKSANVQNFSNCFFFWIQI
jgi:hypothetical protein